MNTFLHILAFFGPLLIFAGFIAILNIFFEETPEEYEARHERRRKELEDMIKRGDICEL